MTAIELDRVEERTEEKKEAWHTRWLVRRPSFMCKSNSVTAPGIELTCKCFTFSSRGDADSWATSEPALRSGAIAYLGAFPVSAP